MMTTTDPRKCEKFGILPFNLDLICQYYKSNYDSTTTKKNGCWNCAYFR